MFVFNLLLKYNVYFRSLKGPLCLKLYLYIHRIKIYIFCQKHVFLFSFSCLLKKKNMIFSNNMKDQTGTQRERQKVLKVAIFIILKLCTGNQRHQSANWYKDQVFLQLAC